MITIQSCLVFCALTMALGVITTLLLWIKWANGLFDFTDKEAAQVWERVAGRDSCGDHRATTIGWKYIKAVEWVVDQRENKT